MLGDDYLSRFTVLPPGSAGGGQRCGHAHGSDSAFPAWLCL